MQVFMTRHDDGIDSSLWLDRHVMMTCTFYTLAPSQFESYFCKSNICIKGLILL
jgi:hypothetical protein